MKKLLSYLLVIALVLVQCLPVLTVNAENGTNEVKDGTITISNAVKGEKYEIYKMFDLESYDKDKKAYTYTIDTTSDWYEFVSTGAGKDYVTLSTYEEGKNIVTWKENKKGDADVAKFARLALDYAEANKLTNNGSKTAESTTVKFEGLELGYYLVDSSLGTLVSLNTTDRNAVIQEKNTPTTIDKTVEENGTYGKYNNSEIGKQVKYKVEIAAKKGAQNYVLTDKMTEGLTFNKNVVVKVGDDTLENGKDYTVIYPETDDDSFTFKVKFTKTYLDSITEDTTIIVTYSATVNENAVINGTGNPNKAKLTYGDKTDTDWSEVRTYVLSFKLVKTDGQNELSGAEFELYRSKTGNDKINLVELKDATGKVYYRVATEAEVASEGFTSAVIKVGSAYIEGLDEGTYYLEETKAPEGYNKLTSRVPVTLKTNLDGINHTTTLSNASTDLLKYTNNQLQVVNTTGELLPSTGGMGTMAFITIGSIMVLGFGVLLVTKLRMSKMTI